MKKYTLLFAFISLCFVSLPAPAQSVPDPGGFTYQAVARTPDGKLLADKDLTIRFSILAKSPDGVLIWQEEHDLRTNTYGMFTSVIGGSDAYNASGSVSGLSDIDWSLAPYYLRVSVKNGDAFEPIGGSLIRTVPMASMAMRAGSSAGNFQVTGNKSSGEEALFEVKRADGVPVFAVYEEGVWVYADADAAKGVKGGFAVGGFSRSKGVVEEYMRITPDSSRIYIPDDSTKSVKGGFAVGGFSRGAKAANGFDFLQVYPDGTSITYDATAGSKGVKGGFAVGGFSRGTKALETNQLVSLKRRNYFIGHQAGVNTTGYMNVFLGFQAGERNTGGDNSVYIGYQAGQNNPSGNDNVMVGNRAGLNSDADFSVFVGNQAGYNSGATSSVIIGNEAGYNALTGFGNVMIGQKAGATNGSSSIGGDRNTFIGRYAGAKNDMGSGNTFLGAYSGRDAVNGRFNTFLGDGTCEDGIPGDGNVYVGYRAGLNNYGEHNVVIGREAGSTNNAYADSSDYDFNVMIGYRAGFSNVNGRRNVFIGSMAGYEETGSDKLYIDNTSTTKPLILGDFSENLLIVNGDLKAVTYSNLSDRRLKQEILPIRDALEKVQRLNGIRYRWSESHPELICGGNPEKVGFLAQEVEEVVPEVVSEDPEGYKGVSYGPLTALLTEAIKEQQELIREQQEQIRSLLKRVDQLEAEIRNEN